MTERKDKPERKDGERGNALLYVFIAIAVLAMLTFAVSDTNDSGTDRIADYAAADEQIARMMTYSGTLGSAISQMIASGARAGAVYSTLSLLSPGQAGYETAPHNMKLYHPMGGGMNVVTSTGNTASSSTVATTFRVNPASIVVGVGPTDVTVGDVLFTAVITSKSACERINFLLTGSASLPTLATVDHTALFVTGSTVTVNAANCPSCVNKAQACVRNTADTAWGFYSSLLPG